MLVKLLQRPVCRACCQYQYQYQYRYTCTGTGTGLAGPTVLLVTVLVLHTYLSTSIRFSFYSIRYLGYRTYLVDPTAVGSIVPGRSYGGRINRANNYHVTGVKVWCHSCSGRPATHGIHVPSMRINRVNVHRAPDRDLDPT